MTSIANADRHADDLVLETGDDEIDECTLDELGLSADLASIRAASARGERRHGGGHD